MLFWLPFFILLTSHGLVKYRAVNSITLSCDDDRWPFGRLALYLQCCLWWSGFCSFCPHTVSVLLETFAYLCTSGKIFNRIAWSKKSRLAVASFRELELTYLDYAFVAVRCFADSWEFVIKWFDLWSVVKIKSQKQEFRKSHKSKSIPCNVLLLQYRESILFCCCVLGWCFQYSSLDLYQCSGV